MLLGHCRTIILKDNPEIENRKQIWMALSEFYLDIQLSNEDLDRISLIFYNSGIHLREIKKIDLTEVFPLLQPNLLSVAGVWDGFDRDWLLTKSEKLYNRRKSIFHRLNCKFWNVFFYWMRRNYWNQIEKRMKIFEDIR